MPSRRKQLKRIQIFLCKFELCAIRAYAETVTGGGRGSRVGIVGVSQKEGQKVARSLTHKCVGRQKVAARVRQQPFIDSVIDIDAIRLKTASCHVEIGPSCEAAPPPPPLLELLSFMCFREIDSKYSL
jgi:hypothetical protein